MELRQSKVGFVGCGELDTATHFSIYLVRADGFVLYSMPSCVLASGLKRSGVHAGVHTTFTVAVRIPGNCSSLAFTCSPIMTCEGQPGEVSVKSTETSCRSSATASKRTA